MTRKTGELKDTQQQMVRMLKEALDKAGIEVTLLGKGSETILADRRDKTLASDRRYNHSIARTMDGAMPKNHVFRLGKPGTVLQSAGIPFHELELAESRLAEKSRHPEHPFELTETRSLPSLLQRPLAVFRSATRENCHVILTNRQHHGKNFIVVVETGRRQGKDRVNSIRSIHYRNSNVHIANWINNGLLAYADKKRMSEWFAKQRYNSADVENRFRHSANIVKNFENPKILQQIHAAEPIFFSNALAALKKQKQQKATPVQWLGMLQKAGGIKKGEDEWTGLSAWLTANEQKTLAYKEVEDYITSHALVLKEWEYGTLENSGKYRYFQDTFNEFVAMGEEETDSLNENDWYEYAFDRMIQEFGQDFDLAFGHVDGKLYVNDSSVAESFMNEHIINSTRKKNTTRGLDTYKELAFFTDDVISWQDDDDIHFGEVGNIQGGKCLAWVRFGIKTVRRNPTPQEMDRMKLEWGGTGNRERIEKDGMVRRKLDCRLLVIDEVQSSRHQEGLRKGYQDPREYEKAEENYHAAHEEMAHFHNYLMEKYGWRAEPKAYTPEERQKMDELEKSHFRALENMTAIEERPPLAPFSKNWHELCMKRMLRYAAENGVDKVLWTTGEQQNERYRLDEYLEQLEVQPPDQWGHKNLKMTTSAGEYVMEVDGNGKVSGEDLPAKFQGKDICDIIGKELGREVMKRTDRMTFRPGEMKVELGQGMKAFYDRMIPQFMNHYGKKWGVRTGSFKAPWLAGNPVFHAVDITPEMKKSVMQGQPMFMTSPKGKLYGYTVGNRIFLTPEGLNTETLVHEYTHVWALAMQRKNPKGWKDVKDLLKDSPVWNEVLKDRNYRDICHNENWVASEALARISGQENSRALSEMARRHGTEGLMGRVQKALGKFWGWVGKDLFGMKEFRSIAEVTDRVLYDLTAGTRMEAAADREDMDLLHKDRLSHISIYTGKGGKPYIRCTIDGQNQLGRPLKGSDVQLYKADDLTRMAVRYYRDELQQQPDTVRSIKR